MASVGVFIAVVSIFQFLISLHSLSPFQQLLLLPFLQNGCLWLQVGHCPSSPLPPSPLPQLIPSILFVSEPTWASSVGPKPTSLSLPLLLLSAKGCLYLVLVLPLLVGTGLVGGLYPVPGLRLDAFLARSVLSAVPDKLLALSVPAGIDIMLRTLNIGYIRHLRGAY